MNTTYDKYYKTENLFGDPYPGLIDFLNDYPRKGKLLDLGCGQGRDAISLARLGYDVTGLDNSKTGIKQMNQLAKTENLKVIGHVADIYVYEDFEEFDVILLDSMFHFTTKDKEKEIGLIRNIISRMKDGSILVICNQDTGNKIQILNQAIDHGEKHHRLVDRPFKYIFEDRESQHRSETDYRMIVIEK